MKPIIAKKSIKTVVSGSDSKPQTFTSNIQSVASEQIASAIIFKDRLEAHLTNFPKSYLRKEPIELIKLLLETETNTIDNYLLNVAKDTYSEIAQEENLEVSFEKYLSDVLNAASLLSTDLIKVHRDTFNTINVLQKLLSMRVAVDSLDTADTTEKSPSKILSDVASTESSRIVQPVKVLDSTYDTAEDLRMSLSRMFASAISVTDDFDGIASTEDDQSYAYLKGVTDSLLFAESVALLASYSRSTVDNLQTTDFNKVDFYKKLDDEISTISTLAFELVTNLMTNTEVSDTHQINSIKSFEDNFSIDSSVVMDKMSAITMKELLDEMLLQDDTFTSYLKSLQDDTISVSEYALKDMYRLFLSECNTTETFERNLVFSRNYHEPVSLGISIHNAFTKKLLNNTELVDTKRSLINKPKSDTLSLNENRRSTVVKSKSETLNLSEVKRSLITKSKSDSLGLSEISRRSFNKLKSESISLAELKRVLSGKFKSDVFSAVLERYNSVLKTHQDNQYVSDTTQVLPLKVVNDFLDFINNLSFGILKDINDSSAAEDTARKWLSTNLNTDTSLESFSQNILERSATSDLQGLSQSVRFELDSQYVAQGYFLTIYVGKIWSSTI